MKKSCFFMAIVLLNLFSSMAYCQQEVIPFDSDKWTLVDAQKTEFLGRKCLQGIATLKDVSFENGIIEFDIAVTGSRSYPGIVFRMQGEDEYERIYVRPHLTTASQNVVQYAGTFKGLDSWQLYGPGKTASAAIPANKWFHVKVEVLKDQARLYINDFPQPVLFIKELAHGISKGTLGVWGPKDGSAYFSNFSYKATNELNFPETVKPDLPLGMITDWEISQPKRLNEADYEVLPEVQGIKDLKWQKIKSLPSGLVDVSRYYGRIGQVFDIIWAKTNIQSDKKQTKQFAFGYSDQISIFLNGKLLFTGNSAYMARYGNFQGIVGLHDYIFLPLNKGKNELVIAVAETFGGWGFMFQDVEAIYTHPSLNKQWEIKAKLNYPESAVYDKKRDVVYVSNYTGETNGFISKIKMNGKVEKLDWVTGIMQPAGVCISNDKLYAVGRRALIEIDIEKGTIANRFPFPEPVFANDIAADEKGTLYITDGGKGAIYKFENGKITEWIKSPELFQINGVFVDKEKIVVGTSRDGGLKFIDPNSKEIKKFFSFSPGTIIDGITGDGKGNYLVGDHAGKLLRISKEGKSELLLNTMSRPIQLADFDFVPEKGLIIIPTMEDNRLMVYKLK